MQQDVQAAVDELDMTADGQRRNAAPPDGPTAQQGQNKSVPILDFSGPASRIRLVERLVHQPNPQIERLPARNQAGEAILWSRTGMKASSDRSEPTPIAVGCKQPCCTEKVADCKRERSRSHFQGETLDKRLYTLRGYAPGRCHAEGAGIGFLQKGEPASVVGPDHAASAFGQMRTRSIAGVEDISGGVGNFECRMISRRPLGQWEMFWHSHDTSTSLCAAGV